MWMRKSPIRWWWPLSTVGAIDTIYLSRDAAHVEDLGWLAKYTVNSIASRPG